MNNALPAIRRSARRLRYTAVTLLILFEVLMLFCAALLLMGRQDDFPEVRITTSGMAPTAAAIAIVLIAVLVGLALLRLTTMLRRIEGGQPSRTAAGLRGFAFWLLLAAIAGVLARPVSAMLDGSDRVSLTIDPRALLFLLLIGLLFLVARLLDAAQAVADDASQIV